MGKQKHNQKYGRLCLDDLIDAVMENLAEKQDKKPNNKNGKKKRRKSNE